MADIGEVRRVLAIRYGSLFLSLTIVVLALLFATPPIAVFADVSIAVAGILFRVLTGDLRDSAPLFHSKTKKVITSFVASHQFGYSISIIGIIFGGVQYALILNA